MSVARYFNPRLRRVLLAGEMPPWLKRHPRKSYIIAAVLSAPDWVDRTELNRLRDGARRKTEETGVQHVMAHIVPLNSPIVCGLTVPWNFKVVPYEENARESNHRWPGMPQPQLTLFGEDDDDRFSFRPELDRDWMGLPGACL